MLWTALLFLAVLVTETPADHSKGKGGKQGTFAEETLVVGDGERSYRLLVPEGLKKAAPLVYVFHGRGGDGKRVARYCGFDALASKEKFIVVYPSGIEGSWDLTPGQEKDLEFFDALHAKLCAQYDIDRNRVYATGMSMGGYFSNFLASRRSQILAAIAPHSGGLGALAFTGISSERKYPVLIVHGTADKVVMVSEGRRSKERYEQAGHEVIYQEIEGLGHRWATQQKITEQIWKFFTDHPKGSEAGHRPRP